MHDRFPRYIKPIAVGGIALALTGCARTGNIPLSSDKLETLQISGAFIDSGATLRHDPNARDDSADGGSNRCAFRLPKAVVLHDQQGYISEGDANGPWVGLELANLPEGLQAKCNSDTDGIVWLIKQKVFMANPSVAAVNASN